MKNNSLINYIEKRKNILPIINDYASDNGLKE